MQRFSAVVCWLQTDDRTLFCNILSTPFGLYVPRVEHNNHNI